MKESSILFSSYFILLFVQGLRRYCLGFVKRASDTKNNSPCQYILLFLLLSFLLPEECVRLRQYWSESAGGGILLHPFLGKILG